MAPGGPAEAPGATPGDETRRRRRLIRVVCVSIAVAILTIALKFAAWLATGSVGLLSDALESVVNLVAAGVALVVVLWSTRPADEDHAYGHEKADYISAGVEGALILLAASTIAWQAIGRLIDPVELTGIGLGLGLSVLSSFLNLLAARLLIRVGRQESSLVLTADGRHLMTDVWTSVGVVLGVTLVWLSGWKSLDPLIALVVAVHILRTGVILVRGSLSGLMDRALPAADLSRVDAVLASFASDEIQFHALRTRQAGRRVFISIHVLVPGQWSVQAGHNLSEEIEEALREPFEQATVFTHLEPIEDPVSFEDTGLDRDQP